MNQNSHKWRVTKQDYLFRKSKSNLVANLVIDVVKVAKIWEENKTISKSFNGVVHFASSGNGSNKPNLEERGKIVEIESGNKTEEIILGDQTSTRNTMKKKLDIYLKQLLVLYMKNKSRCLKITEKVSFNIASEASYVYILSGHKFIKNAIKWSILASIWKPETCGQNETFRMMFKHCAVRT